MIAKFKFNKLAVNSGKVRSFTVINYILIFIQK
jgi:hypothetical protein